MQQEGNTGGQENGTGEDEQVEVNLQKVQARVSPDFQLVLPYGTFELLFTEDFGKIDADFSLDYNFLSNSINASILFTRPYRVLKPGVRLFTGVDFENIIRPHLEDGDVVLAPSDEYVSRTRGVDLTLDATIRERVRNSTSFLITDTFRGDLDEGVVISEGVDLVFRNTLALDGLYSRRNKGGEYLNGIHASTTLDLTFQDRFSNPVSIDQRIRILSHYALGKKWGYRANLGFGYPLKLWQEDLAHFYLLGGYDSLRGFPQEELGAFRYILANNDLLFRFVDISEKLPDVLDTRLKLTRVSVYAIADIALVQPRLRADSPFEAHTALGAGVSATVTGGNRYYTVKLSGAQPLEKGYGPSFYLTLQSSTFSFTESAVFE
jgi:hypothetical protein